MPQHVSAEKRIRTNKKRQQRNKGVKAAVRRATKDMRANLKSEKTPAALAETMSVLTRAAQKGVLKKKTASRRIGRLARAAHKAKTAAK